MTPPQLRTQPCDCQSLEEEQEQQEEKEQQGESVAAHHKTAKRLGVPQRLCLFCEQRRPDGVRGVRVQPSSGRHLASTVS